MLSLHQLALSFGSFGRNDPVIPEKPPPQCQGLKTTNFVPYFGYPGNLNVEGILTIYPEIGPDKSALLGAGHFSGVDPACSSGPNPDVNANSCGIHIHVGTSCGEDAGGHYYKTDADPWSAGYYATESDGTAEVAFALMPGTSSADITGKAVIVHDYDGDRIGCALLEMPMPDQVAAPFGKYFSVPADLSDYAKVISGAKISTTPEKTTIDYMVADVDPACAAGPDLAQSANSCGIHIHAGTSCEQDALGHYYAVGSDPWGEGYYTAQSATDQYFVYAAGKFSLKAGLDQAAITGKTLIVHDQAGGRTHCAPIHAPTGFLGVSTFTAYPGYEGNLTHVAGGVQMTHLPEAGSVHVNALLVGVDPRCSEDHDAPNACGIHIHSGYDCADADTIGGHLYAGESDPWSAVAYQVLGPGRPGTGEDMVTVGMSASDLIGRAFVVHDSYGERIACGLVAPPAEAC